jgi:predicted nucleic acid-binding Zn ribbon protein
MLARTPSNLLRGVRLRPQPVRKLSRHRRIAIQDALAEMMKAAEPTQFALEAPSRCGLRVALIFDGWTWGQADAEAALLVMAALDMAGARRPNWQQGQPEFCQDGHVPQTRERCVRCAKPLPEGHFKYCGKVCAQAAKVDAHRRADREALYAKEKTYRLAWSKRQPPRDCPICGKSFQPKKRGGQTYCSRACSDDAFRLARRSVPALCESV